MDRLKQRQGLDPNAFQQVFPFFLALDAQARVVQSGRGLRRICPELSDGSPADAHLRILRPRPDLNVEALRATAPEFVILELTGGGLVLRGQTLRTDTGILLLVSPWITDASQLERHDLHLTDFAIHDPALDYVGLLAAKDSALADASELAALLQRSNEELEQSLGQHGRVSSRLGALLRHLPFGVLVEDETGHVVLANNQFCALFALPVGPEALIGANCAELALAAKQAFLAPEAFVSGVAQRIAAKETVVGEELELVDGRVLLRDYIPVIDAHGYGGHLWQYRDVTAERRVAQDLQTARARAEEANAAKSAFLAMISHEMRTPLGVIVGLAELLNPRMPAEEQADFMRRMRSNARALLHIIEDVLDLSKLEAGEVRYEQQPVDVAAVVEEVADALFGSARTRGLELIVDIDPEAPTHVIGDRARLRQVLVNLVGNAIKFTQSGEVRVAVESVARQGQIAAVRLAVDDTGPGIPAAVQSRVFERFSRLEAPGASPSPGTGLGLSISRALVQGMGSTIELVSAENAGSRFSFELAAAPPSDAKPRERCAEIENRCFVVIDPLPWARVALAHALQRCGAEVLQAADLEQAWSASKARDIDGVFCDEVRSLEAAAQLFERLPTTKANSRLAWFVMSDEPTKARTMKGRARIIPKGASGEALAARLARRPRSHVPTERFDHAPRTHATMSVRALVADDDADNQLVMVSMLRRLGVKAELASDGQEALLKLGASHFDLLLTDLQMPNVDGIELVQRLRSAEAKSGQPRLPIIAVSAHALSDHADRARAAGVDVFLIKPLDAGALRKAVDQCLHARALAAAPQPIDADLVDMVPGYLANRRADVQRILKALQTPDALTTVRTLGHKMKGTGSAYGFAPLTELGAALERAAMNGDTAAIARLAAELDTYLLGLPSMS